MEKSKARKSYLIVAMLLLLVLVSLGIGFVMAYNSVPLNPSVMGHSFGEVNWNCNIVTNSTVPNRWTYATCAPSDRLVSGGCSVPDGLVAHNRPVILSSTVPNSWYCYAKTFGYNATSYALCCN